MDDSRRALLSLAVNYFNKASRSEKLFDEQRTRIETTFGCAVADGYGSREAGFIAHQCPAGAMHIMAEDIIVEIADESGRPVGRAG
jgi:phenylacetate-CoA ligase